MKANIITLVGIALSLLFLAIHFAHEPWTPMRTAGVIIGLPSLLLFFLARLQLGASFSLRPEARALVTHGLYSRIRNPIYVFGSLIVVALSLYLEQPLVLAMLLVLIPLQVYRARREAQTLEAKFGEQYRQYRARTWF